MKFINIRPENLEELNEFWQEVKDVFVYYANRPKEREKIKNLRSDEILGSPFDFICKSCLEAGMRIEDATHPLQNSYLPKKKTETNWLVCEHCHESGF